jgi:hypothetical protein
MEEYVYGWYCYKDGKDVEFRYPALREADLRLDEKKVKIEIWINGKWQARRGIVVVTNGNYLVVPA